VLRYSIYQNQSKILEAMLCFLLTEKTEYLLNDSIPEHQDLLLPELSNLAYLLDNSIYQNQSILEAMLLLAKKTVKLKKGTNHGVPQLTGDTGRTRCAHTPWLNLLLQLCQGHFFINMKACSVYVGTSDFDRDVIEILGKKFRKADL